MFTVKDLPGHFNEESFPDEQTCLEFLQAAHQQAQGGWGQRRDGGVALRLARDLKIALELADRAEELARQLKGEQMRRGKMEKALKEAQAELSGHRDLKKILEERIEDLEAKYQLATETLAMAAASTQQSGDNTQSVGASTRQEPE